MKERLILVTMLLLVVLCLPGALLASPFVVSDPYPATGTQPTDFSIIIDGGAEIISPAEVVTGGVRLHYDIANVSAGVHNISIKALKVDPVWGRLESTTVPFAFTKPVAPNAVVNIKLEK